MHSPCRACAILVALTLTPVLCAMLLKDTHGQPRRRTPIGVFLDWFDRTYRPDRSHRFNGLHRADWPHWLNRQHRPDWPDWIDRRWWCLGLLWPVY